MTVAIPVSANATSAISEIDRIGDAIRRAGQEGRKFADLDLAHPELTNFAQTIEGVQRQLDDLNKLAVGRTAVDSRFVTDHGPGNPFLQPEFGSAMGQRYPDAAAQAAALHRVNTHAFSGTSLYHPPAAFALPGAPAAPPNAPPGGSAGGGRRAASYRPPPLSRAPPPTKGGNALGGMVRGLMKGPVGALLGLAGVGSLVHMGTTAVSGAKDEAIGNDHLMRAMPGLATDFDALRESVRLAADGMHLTYKQAQDMAMTMQREGANSNRYTTAGDAHDTMLEGVRVAAGLARGFGTDAGGMAHMVGKADASGVDPRTFAKLLAGAVAEGGMSGKSDAVGQSLLSYIEATSRAMPSGGVEGMSQKFAEMFTSMNASSAVGLHGANAAQMIGNIDQSVRAGGGGGQASTALNYRAFARSGITDPYRMLYKQEEGMFGDLGNGETTFSAQRKLLDEQYKGRDPMERLHAMSRHFNISMHGAEAMDKLKDVDLNRANKALHGMGLDPAKLNPEAYADIAQVMTPHADLEAQRTKLLKGGKLTEAETQAVSGASGDKLRDEMVKAINAHGTEKTQGQSLADLDKDMGNALTSLGTHLLVPLEAIEKGVVGMLKGIELIAADALKNRPPNGGRESGVDQYNNPLMTPDSLQLAPGLQNGGLAAPPRSLLDAGSEGATPGTTGGLTNGATVQRVMALMAVGGRAGRPGGMLGSGGGGGAYNGTPAAPLAAGQAANNAQYAYDFFRKHGYTHEQSTGIVAGNIAESGMRTDADGDNHRSGGIGQWNGARRAAFAKMFGHDVRDGTLQEQLEFEQWELTHTEKAAGDAIRASTTFGGAVDAHTRRYERPQFADKDSRIRSGIAMANERGFRERHMPGEHPAPGGDVAGETAGGAHLHRTSYQNGGHPIEFAPLRVIIEDGKGGVRSAHTVAPQQLGRPSPYGQTSAPRTRLTVPGGAGRTYAA